MWFPYFYYFTVHQSPKGISWGQLIVITSFLTFLQLREPICACISTHKSQLRYLKRTSWLYIVCLPSHLFLPSFLLVWLLFLQTSSIRSILAAFPLGATPSIRESIRDIRNSSPDASQDGGCHICSVSTLSLSKMSERNTNVVESFQWIYAIDRSDCDAATVHPKICHSCAWFPLRQEIPNEHVSVEGYWITIQE